ncbi:type IV pilus twitching motility protein PilT [Sodalis glossinidius]|uniref:type IV pilus twitching motility protein PilT n=1 Tax=Sodalis glossinidius TaxID=63612 RepID=UPI0002EC5C3E|nr:ATPase, T2SS/T4P/T4SS family [Sodalis glossinidius]
MELDNLVGHSVKHNASDLHLCPGRPPIIRVDGLLRPLEAPTLTEGAIADCAQRYLGIRQRCLLARGGQRLRAHFFAAGRSVAVSLRIIPSRPPSMAELGLPAAMVSHLNDSRALHIITPSNTCMPPGSALFTSGKSGAVAAVSVRGLRAALREDPDVILLGELRDCASIALALTAAETGHLLLCTLHAGSLLGVMAQQLVRRPAGGWMGLFELLTITPAVRHLIREGKTHLLPRLLPGCRRAGNRPSPAMS